MNPTVTDATKPAPETRQAAAEGRKITIRIRRQDGPDKPSRWETFAVPYRANMNIISCLQWIAANPVTTDGTKTSTPVWDSACLEEVCGACTMVINGKSRQSCSASNRSRDEARFCPVIRARYDMANAQGDCFLVAWWVELSR